MWPTGTSKLLNALKINLPIIQAPMAGGATTPELVAAVSNAGGLGSIGAGYLSPIDITKAIKQTQKLTSLPFSVNLFVPQTDNYTQNDIENINLLLHKYRNELGIKAELSPQIDADLFNKQMNIILQENFPIVSFTFGLPSINWINKLKDSNKFIIGTATTVEEALLCEEQGCDAVVVQGYEAGGHRATFLDDSQRGMIGTMALIPQVVDQLHIPVIAAGGIMDGRGVAAALILGASCAQMGTAFLTTYESGIHPIYKEAILESTEQSTTLTNTFSGKYARGIQNRYMNEMAEHKDMLSHYPLVHYLTTDIRQAAAREKRPEFMSMWSGQGTRLNKVISASELVTETASKAKDLLQLK